MCPSDIYQLPVTTNGFGPAAEVFSSAAQFPCSIALKDQQLMGKVKIQVAKNDTNIWMDYEEGQLLIGNKIKCRVAFGGEIRTVAIEVFHT
ncbi:hypothetical protein ACFLR1_06825 [Bacteroidota bacterium]